MSSNTGVVFLSGKLVNLRPISKLDIPTITRWINNPEVRHYLSTIFPQTEKAEEEWYEKISNSKTDIVLVIETKAGVAIGLMGIHRIDWVNRNATTGAVIGEKEYWGKGYGTDAKMILLEYIFHTLNIHKVGSSVFTFNKRSLHYSLHCGYKVEGRKRKHIWRSGKYWDLIELAVFYPDWLPIWKKYRKTGRIR